MVDFTLSNICDHKPLLHNVVGYTYFTKCTHITVCEFHDFSVTQILREIIFENFRSANSAVFAILGADNFVNLVHFSLQKVQKPIKIKVESLEICQNDRICTSKFPKNDFT